MEFQTARCRCSFYPTASSAAVHVESRQTSQMMKVFMEVGAICTGRQCGWEILKLLMLHVGAVHW